MDPVHGTGGGGEGGGVGGGGDGGGEGGEVGGGGGRRGGRGGVGGAIGGGGAALLRQYENVSVTSALFEHDPGFVAVMRKVLPVPYTLELSAYGKPEHLLAILSWLLRP